LSGGQGYFHREDAKSAKKRDFKNFAFFAVDFWGCGWAALCSSIGGFIHTSDSPGEFHLNSKISLSVSLRVLGVSVVKAVCRIDWMPEPVFHSILPASSRPLSS